MTSILIADGSPAIRHSLRQMFRDVGWDVCEVATDGRDAIAKAERLKPDVVVLDFAMPAMNGITTARFLKKIIPHAHLILFTFSDDLLSPEEVQFCGISAVVSKLEAGKLMMKVQSLVEAA